MTECERERVIDDLDHLINYCIDHTELDYIAKGTLRAKWANLKGILESQSSLSKEKS